MEWAQRTLLELLIEQRDLDPEVVQAVRLILDTDKGLECGVDHSEAERLIRVLVKAADREDVDHKVMGII